MAGEPKRDGAQGDLHGAGRRVCRWVGRADLHGERWGDGAEADGPREGGLHPYGVDEGRQREVQLRGSSERRPRALRDVGEAAVGDGAAYGGLRGEWRNVRGWEEPDGVQGGGRRGANATGEANACELHLRRVDAPRGGVRLHTAGEGGPRAGGAVDSETRRCDLHGDLHGQRWCAGASGADSKEWGEGAGAEGREEGGLQAKGMDA